VLGLAAGTVVVGEASRRNERSFYFADFPAGLSARGDNFLDRTA
jgi:hypothetical protein